MATNVRKDGRPKQKTRLPCKFLQDMRWVQQHGPEGDVTAGHKNARTLMQADPKEFLRSFLVLEKGHRAALDDPNRRYTSGVANDRDIAERAAAAAPAQPAQGHAPLDESEERLLHLLDGLLKEYAHAG